MAGIEKIQGSDIIRLFRELQKDRTLLRLYLPDDDFKHLTRITDIQTRKKTTFIVIDHPESIDTLQVSAKTEAMEFEFTGKDEIKYAFRGVPVKFTRNKIWLPLPPAVKREQRRRQFRISAPAGSIISFHLQSVRYELKIIDISLGGSLGVLAGTAQKNSSNSRLLQTGLVDTLELNFPSGNERVQVIVNRAKVIRLERNPRTKQYEFALEFQEIDSINKRKLNDLIYRLQREFLRKRLPVNA